MSQQIKSYLKPLSPLRIREFLDQIEQPRGHADRRSPQRRADRRALMRLRQAEFVAADYLPADLMQELTAAIDGVVAIVRGAA